jgi:protein kinase-like protein
MPDNGRFENYELLRRDDGSVFELGRGAMGVTYKAFDTDLHCNVALKVINPSILGSADARERFLREARAAAKLRHPNIATVFRLGRAADDTHFYAMEFCEGPTLAQAVAQRGPFPAAEAVRIAWQVSKTLILAEQHRLLHRDLKPSNLILTERPDEGLVAKVIDFGLAKSFADGQQSLATMSTGGFVGTAQFASPEQLEEKELDIRSDVYSLGVCLWFMLAGRPPFEGSLARVMSQTLTAEPPWDALDGRPDAVVALLRKMLAKNREDRPANAMALRLELEACLQSLAAPVPGADAPRMAKTAAGPLDESAFNARFPMSERIGRDALGRIFRAADTERGGARVAVHALDPGFSGVPSLRREIETRVAGAMAHPHPNLLAPLAYSSGARGFLIATPWTEGFTLLDLLKQRGALAPAEMLRVLEPLARAAGHAVRQRLAGLDLSKEQIVAHFPSGLSDADRASVLAAPLDRWPEFEIKAGVLSLGALAAEAGTSLASMATMAPAAGPPAALAPVKTLAVLACEMLGASGNGAFAPIARLSEKANAVLRRAIGESDAFPSPAAFFDAMRAAIGSGGTSAAPHTQITPGTTALRLVPERPSRFKRIAVGALVLIAFGSLGAGYWFGIHRPRERDREKREADTEAAQKQLADKQLLLEAEKQRAKAEVDAKQRIADAEAQRAKSDLEKARAEAERAKTELEKAKLAAMATPVPKAVTAQRATASNLSGLETRSRAIDAALADALTSSDLSGLETRSRPAAFPAPAPREIASVSSLDDEDKAYAQVEICWQAAEKLSGYLVNTDIDAKLISLAERRGDSVKTTLYRAYDDANNRNLNDAESSYLLGLAELNRFNSTVADRAFARFRQEITSYGIDWKTRLVSIIAKHLTEFAHSSKLSPEARTELKKLRQQGK